MEQRYAVTVNITGINGEKNSKMDLYPHGIDVWVGGNSYWALNQVENYQSWFQDGIGWGGDKVAFDVNGDNVKVTVIVPHLIISVRKAEFQVAKATLLAHIEALMLSRD